MDEARARELLEAWIQSADSALHRQDDLYAQFPEADIVEWDAAHDAEYDAPERRDTAYLDGRFTADQLEAIAFWMRNKRRA